MSPSPSPAPVTARPHRRTMDRDRTCERCGRGFTSGRHDVKWCTDACRQASWKARRKHWALVEWVPRSEEAKFTFFSSRAEAVAAAPNDKPSIVVDINTRPRRPRPLMSELLATRRIPGVGDPYLGRKGRYSGV
jgi:hypothetical protein